MSDYLSLARSSLRSAMTLRRDLSISREVPINAFDVAHQLGADVRFLDTPSLDGMFVRDPGLRILLPSLRHRPRGRVLFSCAHEIGHLQFGHGTKVDLYIEAGARQPGYGDEEFLADSFAGHLLMPRQAVLRCIDSRRLRPERLTAQEAFVIAGELGVGYSTLLIHISSVLDLITRTHARDLIKVAPKAIKSDLVGHEYAGPLSIVDSNRANVPIDLEQGELVVFPVEVSESTNLLAFRCEHNGMNIFEAVLAGSASITLAAGRVAKLRVARKHYVGALCNRYLADPDEYEPSEDH